MNSRPICILFGLMVIASILDAEILASAQPERVERTVILNAKVLLDEQLQMHPINFTFEVTMQSPDTTPYPTLDKLSFSFTINGSSSLTMVRKVTLTSRLPFIADPTIYSNSCISLSKVTSPKLSEPSGWSASFDGRNYIYRTLSPGYPLYWISSPRSQSTPFLGFSYNVSASILRIDLILVASSANKYWLDLSPLQELSSRIGFDPPEGAHAGLDIRSNRILLIARQNISDLTLSGFYYQKLPDVLARTVSLPFKLSIDLKKEETIRIGSELTKAVVSSADRMMNDDITFLNDTRVLAPEIIKRLRQAKSDLVDFELQNDQLVTSYNTFPLERSLKLILEAHDEIRALIFSSSLLVAPITLVVVFILGAIGSHLLFNGSKKITVVLFVVFYLLAFQVHPGLRLFTLSRSFWLASSGPSYRTLPFIALVAVSIWISLLLFLGAALLVFKYSGTASIYSLAASNAVRLVKSRKLRGALTMVTIAVIAMATVPSITLKTVVPIVSNETIVTQNGENMICFSNSWSLSVAIYGPGIAVIQESNGFFPMSYGEAVFNANKLGLEQYTPICISAYKSPELSGSIIFANLTFLSNYSGLKLEKSPSASDDTHTVFMNGNLFLQNQFLPDYLTVEGKRLKVSGTFRASTLLMLNGQELETYLKANKLFIGVPDYASLVSLPVDLSTATGNATGKFSIPVPIIGVADIRAVENLPSHDRVILVIGTHFDEKTLPEVEDYLRSLISSDKMSLGWTIPQGAYSTAVTFVSSYSAMMVRGFVLETLRVGFPMSMALGTWYSQLILMSIGTLIILVVILNSTYERRREAVIMSSLGASPGFITYSFVAEGLMLGIMGGCIGYILGYIWAYWIGVSSPEIATELYSLSPLLLVLLTSMVVTVVGSAFPAREAILRVVPSKVMLNKEIGYVTVERDGSRKVPIPLRLREAQLERFSSSISNMVRDYSSTRYGVAVRSHQRIANGEKILLDYRGFVGASERRVTYEVKINYVLVGEFYHLEFVVRSAEEEWTKNHQALMKNMIYDLREEILKITLSRHWETG